MKVTKQCLGCTKTVKRNRNSYCSRECKKVHLNWCNYGNCKVCQKSLQAKGTFCSRNCSATFNNKAVLERRKDLGLTSNCPNCGEFSYARTKNGRKLNTYCNRACYFEHRLKKAEIRVENNEVQTRTTLRSYLIKTRGHKCSICGLEEWRGQPTPLIIDHINGNSEQSTNDNIRMVCPNCDAQLPTYMGRNKGNGRKYRRELYAKGEHYQ